MFNDLTVHSYDVGELEGVFGELDMTVDGLANSGLNVRGLAVMSHLLTYPTPLGQQVTHDELEKAAIYLDDYVI